MRGKLARITIGSMLAVGLGLALLPTMAAAALLKPGDRAPDFSTEAVVGDKTVPVKLDQYRGRTVVLYFYPKDMTPGCTKEACSFRDGYAKIKQAGIVLLGCSVDSADSHREFIKKYQLPFPLLLDPDKKIASAYGTANGIPKYGADSRVTYIIGPDGVITRIYPKVDPATHANEIIHDLGAAKSRIAGL